MGVAVGFLVGVEVGGRSGGMRGVGVIVSLLVEVGEQGEWLEQTLLASIISSD